MLAAFGMERPEEIVYREPDSNDSSLAQGISWAVPASVCELLAQLCHVPPANAVSNMDPSALLCP